MKKLVFLIICTLLFTACSSDKADLPTIEPPKEVPEKLAIGYQVAVTRFTTEGMKYAKSVGIEYVEASAMNAFFDDNGNFTKSDAEAKSIMNSAKKAADEAGIKIWSIHMAYSEKMDLSTINEEDRKHVVAGHKKLLEYIKILKPEVVLFHPSYYLAPNQRDMRKSQMIKSANELDEAVRAIGATLVLENMLGPELMSGQRERPLMRTVEETVEIFNRLPNSIMLAVDMNHISNPERMVRALGKRLKTIHAADGTGRAENHFFPCSGEGQNNWVEILSALDEVGYSGPFLYESAFEDEKDLVNCYNTLYNNFINKK